MIKQEESIFQKPLKATTYLLSRLRDRNSGILGLFYATLYRKNIFETQSTKKNRFLKKNFCQFCPLGVSEGVPHISPSGQKFKNRLGSPSQWHYMTFHAKNQTTSTNGLVYRDVGSQKVPSHLLFRRYV